LDADIKCNMISPHAGTRMVAMLLREGPDLEEYMQVTPESVAPSIVYLAHEECQLNGTALSVSFGRLSTLLLQQTEHVDVELTPESIRDRIADITNESTTHTPPPASPEPTKAYQP
jgi:hypothetical protein